MVSTEVEKKRVWLKPLMRGAGIVLPLVCNVVGILVVVAMSAQNQTIDNQNQQTDWSFLLLLGALLLGAVSAVLFRSWWALLVVPIAFALGGLLAFYLIPLVISPNPLEIGEIPFAVGLWEVIGPIPVILGACIGTFIVKKWGRNWLQ